jgi:SAM-dependent methyltransferase
VGIDASAAMIRLARARAPSARFRVASLTTASIPRCDAVIAIGEVVTYLPSWRAVRRFIAQVHDALTPGGLFLFDFIETAERRTYAPKTMTGRDWTLTARADVSRDGCVLTRRMTTVRAVGTKKRRAHETHRVRIYSREEMLGALATAGFQSTMGHSFGNYRLMTADVAVIARSDYDVPL